MLVMSSNCLVHLGWSAIADGCGLSDCPVEISHPVTVDVVSRVS